MIFHLGYPPQHPFPSEEESKAAAHLAPSLDKVLLGQSTHGPGPTTSLYWPALHRTQAPELSAAKPALQPQAAALPGVV